MTIKRHNTKNGYAILELLFYISFFAVLTLVVINAMMVMAKSFRETAIYAELGQSGNILERMSREIRIANDITSLSASGLVLNTGTNKTMEFRLASPNIELWDNGVNKGNLNSPKIIVTGLTFTEITTTKGKAVKIVLSVRSANDSLSRIVDFYDTIVLRGSY